MKLRQRSFLAVVLAAATLAGLDLGGASAASAAVSRPAASVAIPAVPAAPPGAAVTTCTALRADASRLLRAGHSTGTCIERNASVTNFSGQPSPHAGTALPSSSPDIPIAGGCTASRVTICMAASGTLYVVDLASETVIGAVAYTPKQNMSLNWNSNVWGENFSVLRCRRGADRRA
jgi:hypothetical protein